MNPRVLPFIAAPMIFLSGCVTMPTGPSVAAMPGNGKSFDQFRADDADCRNYAVSQAGSAQEAANNSQVQSAALGTVIGALAGAAIGGSGRAAGVGAGAGLLFGAAAGGGASQASGYGVQRRYDAAYMQCMYAKGDRVPVNGRMMSQNGAPPPNNTYYPPPPPPGSGYPPPPPPGQ